MVSELVTFKLDKTMLAEVDKTFRQAGFGTRTEFIRTALRDKIEDIRMKRKLARVDKLWGSSPTNTADEDLERTREKVFNQLVKERGLKLD